MNIDISQHNLCIHMFQIQVAHLAVFVYFGASLFSKQFLIPPAGQIDTNNFPNVTLVEYASIPPFDKHTPGLVFPFFTLVELVCYLGWVKVAESLLNPFGGLCIRIVNELYAIYYYTSENEIFFIQLLFQMTTKISISTI